MSKRYYAQFTDVSHLFQSRWKQAWQVFDRQHNDSKGEVLAVALCNNRTYAYRIRDTLNTADAQL